MSRTVLSQSILSEPRPSPPHARRWSWVHYLALVGVPLLLINGWTVIAWLADGPASVTQFRDPGSANWYVARIVEGLSVIGSILVIIHLVRGCRRTRRVLTF